MPNFGDYFLSPKNLRPKVVWKGFVHLRLFKIIFLVKIFISTY